MFRCDEKFGKFGGMSGTKHNLGRQTVTRSDRRQLERRERVRIILGPGNGKAYNANAWECS